jgi:pimeloyl-ACP methyl ester carboxylesterase
LQGRGIGSCAFDFLGHGESGGELTGSSLKARTEQAEAVIATQRLAKPLKLMAASMGAYSAVRLTDRFPVAAMVLIVPAMYAAAAYAAPFGGSFRALIRQPDSWRASDAWEVLARFRGRLLVVAGECDTVIPRGVIRRIVDAAESAASRRLFIAPRASHRALTDLRANNPGELARVLDLIAETLI